jgi:hypothetical protein
MIAWITPCATCGHAYGLHAQVGSWCAHKDCSKACDFAMAELPMFSFNLASKPKLRHGLVKLAFRCGCAAWYSQALDRNEKLRFCQRIDCAASGFAKEVYDEYLTEQRAYEESEIIRLPSAIAKPGSAVGVLGMLAGLIKRGG